MQSAAVQSVTMTIIGIISAGERQTELESDINSTGVSTYVVASSLLAKAFSVRLEGDFEERDFEERLLEKLPLKAEAEIEGNKIIKISAAKEM